ncbi:MAG TPA: tripartite tricarboxylate transporter TctB family protein [Pseudolabrys sp.]|nr:tripartite tricarboxylate transporter TctB family protein [Pseudolabrys sp.]
MGKSAIRSTFPYLVGLAVAAVLFHYAQTIEYTPRPGMLGPDFWPKMAIGLMAIVCLFEIGRIVLGLRGETHGVADALEKEDQEEAPATYPWLLAGGIVLVSVYAVVVDILGFLLSTFLFLSAFMYLGRYRRHGAIWATSAVVTLLAALIFMRIAYVSLPRGEPPFDAVTDFVRVMMGG